MQFCDGRKFEEYNPNLQSMYAQMEESEAIIFGMPVYQYSMSGVLKNILDICGGALKQKYVGIIVNAG
jgi:FAD reductase [NAD(P)H]